jgi:hypothetical protein
MRHYLNRAHRGALLSPLLLGGALLATAGAGPAQAQSAQMDSTLTSTQTAQVLQLRSTVFPLGNGLYRWQFTLTNPIGNTSRIRFFTIAPNCDLTQVSNVQSPAGWMAQVFRNTTESPDAPKLNFVVGNGQPGPFDFNSPWLNPVFGQNVKLFSFDLPFGANNQTGRAGALNTYGFSGATLGCQIGSLTITGACPPQANPSVFRVNFRVRFMNRGNVTITLTRGGNSISQSLPNVPTGDYFLDFNLGTAPAADEIVVINGAATENGVTVTATATSRITAPIVILPGMRPTDSQDSALYSGDPNGLVSYLSGHLQPVAVQGTGLPTGGQGQIPQTGFPTQIPKPVQLPTTDFVCPPIIKVLMFCPTGDPLSQAADMVDQGIQQVKTQTGFSKVHLVGHGGGAILARYYIAMRDGGGRSVRTLSLVSPPNQGSLLAILSPNRNGFDRMWPAYPFWKMYTGGTLYSSPQNQILTQVLGFKAPNVPTAVIYGTGTETPALAVGSPQNPYLIENGSGDGVVLESSATALVGASLFPIPNLKFTNGLSNPSVGAAIAAHILAH